MAEEGRLHWIKFPRALADLIEHLSDEDAAAMVKAFCRYMFDGQDPLLPDHLSNLWLALSPTRACEKKKEERNKNQESRIKNQDGREGFTTLRSSLYADAIQRLRRIPKWERRSDAQVMSVEMQALPYIEDFILEQIQSAISGDWSNIVFRDTPRKYSEWLDENDPTEKGLAIVRRQLSLLKEEPESTNKVKQSFIKAMTSSKYGAKAKDLMWKWLLNEGRG